MTGGLLLLVLCGLGLALLLTALARMLTLITHHDRDTRARIARYDRMLTDTLHAQLEEE